MNVSEDPHVEQSGGRLRLTDKEIDDFAIRADHITGRDWVFLESDVERIVTQRVRDAATAAQAPSVVSSAVDRAAAVEAVLAEMGGHIERASNRVYEWPEDEADLHRNGDHRSFTERSAMVSRLRAEKIVDAVLGCATSASGDGSALPTLAHPCETDGPDSDEGLDLR